MMEEKPEMATVATDAVGPVFVDAARRSETVPLEWPVIFDGVTYSAITVRRPVTADVRAWADKVRSSPDVEIPLPMYDAPDAVIMGLDPDDDEKVGEVAKRFLPRSFRTEAVQTPSSGEATSPTSPTT